MELLPSSRPRVVQWATGNVGAHALRAVIEHPGLSLAGVLVHDRAKAGRDAAALCGGAGRTGITATTEIADILALRPDCVLYMPRLFDVDEVCRLLAAGIDVVTTHAEPRHPASMDPRVCARLEAACWFGGATLLSTGVAPGFVTETLPAALSSLHRQVDRITVEEEVDLACPAVEPLVLETMGFGTRRPGLGEERLLFARRLHEPSLRLLAETLRLPIDTVTVHGATAAARTRVTVAGTVLDPGTVAAQQITVAGSSAGRTLLVFRSTWHCSHELDADWPTRATGWYISVEGPTPVELSMRYGVRPEELAAVSPRYAANRAVNAVGAVCAAPPGIRTTTDLASGAVRFG